MTIVAGSDTAKAAASRDVSRSSLARKESELIGPGDVHIRVLLVAIATHVRQFASSRARP